MSETFALDREITAAKLLLAALADIIEGDDQLKTDMLEAETEINEAILRATDLYCRDKCSVEAIEEHIKMMESRKARLKKRMENTRVLVGVALETCGRKRIETALGCATLKPTPRKIVVDPDREHLIPLDYWKRSDPSLDKKKLTEDLKSGKVIDGAHLDNGGVCVAFTFK